MTPPTPALDLAQLLDREEAPRRFVKSLFAALRTARLRGPQDPQTVRVLEETRDAALAAAAGQPHLRLVRSGPHVWLDRVRLRPTSENRLQLRTLWQELERLGIAGFEFSTDLGSEEWLQFVELYPRLIAGLEGDNEDRREIVPGIFLLAVRNETVVTTSPDRRAQAREAFFHALAAARGIVRQFSVNRIPELRKTRAIVHEMVDTLVEEEFSLLGLASIQNFDPYTFQHSVHVSVLAMALGQRLGLQRSEVASLGVAAMFHDLGKTRVPTEVLRKPGRFDEQEWTIMRTHPLSGARELLRHGAVSDLMVQVMLVSAEHHLRFDGSGYPRLGDHWHQGLFARIVTIADCFDAMTASRIYMKRPFTPDAVIRYLFENSGRMFDPDLLRIFVGMVGLYPVGSLVRLESGELALVVEPPTAPGEIDRPSVALLVSTDGGWRMVGLRALAQGSTADPRYRIQAGAHPLDHGVDIDALLSEHFLSADAP